MKLLFNMLMLLPFYAFSQEVITVDGVDCDVHGTASMNSKTYYQNGLKNRYEYPQAADFDTAISFPDLIASADPNQFSQNKAIKLSGYVFNVKTGGVESCNCKSKNPEFRDTHIELTPDGKHVGPESRIIVEVTPRIREMLAVKDVSWSTYNLKQILKGKMVEVEGWLFYDVEHENAAFANDPGDQFGTTNWRATCWEVHPATAIRILKDGASLNETYTHRNTTDQTRPTLKKQSAPAVFTPYNNTMDPQGKDSFKYLLAALFVIALAIIIIMITRKR